MAKHDSLYKELLSDPRMLRSALRVMVALGVLPATLVDQFDLENITQVPTELVNSRLLKRYTDKVWRIFARGTRETAAYMMTECQSKSDPNMQPRITEYVSLLERAMKVAEGLKPRHPTPPMLPVVFHNGRKPWKVSTGKKRRRQSNPVADQVKALVGWIRYFLLDIRSCDLTRLPEEEPMTWWIRMERARTIPELQTALQGAARTMPGEEFAGLRKVFFRWVIESRWKKRKLLPTRKVLRATLDGGGKDMGSITDWNADRWYNRVHGEGEREGVRKALEAQRETLCSRAGKRFGEETSRRLADLIARVDDLERFADVGEWIVTCETGEELLARLNGSG